jgi:hypothetical protein
MPEQRDVPPDQRRVGPIQAKRLASLAGLQPQEIEKATVAELSQKLKWKVDPALFFFRRICGRVVKTDPSTGIDYPVPFATVHVEDTDCTLLWYFPLEAPWGWFFPLICRREEIGTVVTDACGRFCVWVPRWDIDWILRWRLERVCFPIIFQRPTFGDILQQIRTVYPKPGPGPDPPERAAQVQAQPAALSNLAALRHVEEIVGHHSFTRLAAAQSRAVAGAKAADQSKLLNAPAFKGRIAPPLPREISGRDAEAVKRILAQKINLDPKQLEALDLKRFIGPFLRCYTMLLPEWQLVLDAPDITFRVTQDVNGDGTEETIYSEGLFDVRWDSGDIPDVTLHASQIAVAGISCDLPTVPAGEGIVLVGLMPVQNPALPADPYFDSTNGYALRVNRPHPDGNLAPPPPPKQPSTAPFCRTLQLYGGNQRAGAQFYRLRYSYNGAATLPYKNLAWQVYRVVGGILQVHAVTADSEGWYPILNPADNWLPGSLLLNWPTGQDGLYTIDMQFADGTFNPDGTRHLVGAATPPLSILVDNAASGTDPVGIFTGFAWRVAGAPAWTPLDLVCPVVRRPAGADIEFRVSYQASADHLRSVTISGGGCGSGLAPNRKLSPDWSDPAGTVNPYEHFYTGPLDNSITRTAIFAVPHTHPEGAYSFDLYVDSRTFNPAGGDGGFEADWEYDPSYNWVWPQLKVGIVNA